MPKRVGLLFERIIEPDNLRLALRKALRGKRSKTDAIAFAVDALGDDLQTGRMDFSEYHQFPIRDPKERWITAPSFRLRVAHHAIINVCEPVFERHLIPDSFACRVGKGRLKALERAREFAGRRAFFLKMDIRKYFNSISHTVLIKQLERRFKDKRLLDLFWRIIESYGGRHGRGLPIGSLTSQHFANLHLSDLDRLIKERLRAFGYVRYMDDFVVWGNSSAQLRDALNAIRMYLGEELKLALRPEPYINRSAHGMDFLGCRVYPWGLKLNRASRTRFGRKLTVLERSYLAGRIDEAELQQRGTALTAFTTTPGLASWRCRQAVLKRSPVSGREPGTA